MILFYYNVLKEISKMNNELKKASRDYSFNYAEHLIKRRAEGKLLLGRFAIIALALVLFSILAYFTFGPVKLPHITVVASLLILYVCKLLWGLTSVEYEYLIMSNSLAMDKIYSGKKRRQVTEFTLSDAISIAPLSETKLRDERVLFCATSKNDPDLYCAVYKKESGESEALVFNVNEKTLDMLRYYYKATVIK